MGREEHWKSGREDGRKKKEKRRVKENGGRREKTGREE